MDPVVSASLPIGSVKTDPTPPGSGLVVAAMASPLCRFSDVLGSAAAEQLLMQVAACLGEGKDLELADIGDLASAVGRLAGLACDLLGVEPPLNPRLTVALVTGDDHGRPNAAALSCGAEDPPCVAFIYWLHARPRRFGGGQLRVYDLGIREGQLAIDAEYRDCPVEHDTIVFFPSSSWSELRPVTGHGDLRFMNAALENRSGTTRFAIRGYIR